MAAIDIDAISDKAQNRKEFEDLVKAFGDKSRNVYVWIKYGQWAESQKKPTSACSIYLRALAADQNSMNPTLWLKYVNVTIECKPLKDTRGLFSNALSVLPRENQLWQKYVHMEETLGNVDEARGVFEKWMEKNPDHQGWLSYVEFELRYNEIDRAREIYERYTKCYPKKANPWISYAKFELKNKEIALAQNCYKRAVKELMMSGDHDDEELEILWKAYIDFELHEGELGNAKAMYERLLDLAKQFKAWVISADKLKDYVSCVKHGQKLFVSMLDQCCEVVPELKDNRKILLDEWNRVETELGEIGDVRLVQAKKQKEVLKRKKQILNIANKHKRLKTEASDIDRTIQLLKVNM